MLNKARSLYNKLDRDGQDAVQMGCAVAIGVIIMVIWI